MANAVDKEQMAMLSQWWKRYGRFIAVAVIIGLVLGFGIRHWINQKKLYRVQASATYQSLFNALGKSDVSQTNRYLSRLQHDFPDSVYASLGALLQARWDSEHDDYAAALQQLQWVMQHGSPFPHFQQLAYIRAARIHLQQKQYEQALAQLQPIKESAFMPLVDEIRGDIYLAQGNKNQAKTAYQAALAGFAADHIDNPLLEMKWRAL